ncbi:hypothetical protein BV898_16583 [Hypsibius exemplaris]|uniref:UPAR/Ly6 domain-containing protein n=1 Tax=Hypsibius exemplaris TaxID=2072580 RepID=A0A9X6NDI1_HYPEX|nr:hypothetical protein BV898_16583 [Hypsibius exemplaris]
MKHLLSIIALVVCLAVEGTALRCHVCNSHTQGTPTPTNPKCSDPFSVDGATVVECTTTCQTTRATATHPLYGVQHFTERRCAATAGTVGCIDQMVGGVPYMTICHCDSDLCNAAPAAPVQVPTTIPPTSVATSPSAPIIQCYQCNHPFNLIFEGPGNVDPNCNDPFTGVGITTVNCRGSCVTQAITFSADVGIPHLIGQTIISRSCDLDEAVDLCFDDPDQSGLMSQRVCYCSGNLCNRVPVIPPAIITTPTAIINPTVAPEGAIKCYVCNDPPASVISGTFDPKCNDPFDGVGVTVNDCWGKCVKHTMSFAASFSKPNLAGKTIVSRRCEPESLTENVCSDSTAAAGVTHRICHCSGNFCNGVLLNPDGTTVVPTIPPIDATGSTFGRPVNPTVPPVTSQTDGWTDGQTDGKPVPGSGSATLAPFALVAFFGAFLIMLL